MITPLKREVLRAVIREHRDRIGIPWGLVIGFISVGFIYCEGMGWWQPW